MSMPTWLRTHLETTGAIDPHTGASRRARGRRCPTCRALTLIGYDGDTLIQVTTVDPTPLSALGEALALATGRRTLELRSTLGRLELDRRDAWHIKGHPAGTPGNHYDVVAEHRCGTPPLPAAPSQLTPITGPTLPTEPPF